MYTERLDQILRIDLLPLLQTQEIISRVLRKKGQSAIFRMFLKRKIAIWINLNAIWPQTPYSLTLLFFHVQVDFSFAPADWSRLIDESERIKSDWPYFLNTIDMILEDNVINKRTTEQDKGLWDRTRKNSLNDSL